MSAPRERYADGKNLKSRFISERLETARWWISDDVVIWDGPPLVVSPNRGA
jgi:hypothetical protein